MKTALVLLFLTSTAIAFPWRGCYRSYYCPPLPHSCPSGSLVFEDCCFKCANRRCDQVQCGEPYCLAGEEEKLLPGNCCPKCVPTGRRCDQVQCGEPYCLSGEEEKLLPGNCCPECVPVERRCDQVQCGEPYCLSGEEERLLPGQCCPECVPVEKKYKA